MEIIITSIFAIFIFALSITLITLNIMEDHKGKTNRPGEFPLREVEKGQLYRHFKGDLYKIIASAWSSEDHKVEMVVYQQHPVGAIWVRPLTMFNQEVLYTGDWVPRFERVYE